MRLRTRLFLTILLLCGLVAGALAVIVQRAWRLAEQERFEDESQAAWSALSADLAAAPERLASELLPHCESNPLIDSALVGLLSGTLDQRLIGVQDGIPNLMRSMQLDGLVLALPDGEAIGGTWPEANLDAAVGDRATLRPHYVQSPEPGFVAACQKSERGQSLTLLGYRKLAPLLEAASRGAALHFQLADGSTAIGSPGLLVQRRALEGMGGREIVATRSSRSLVSSLRQLNAEVATAFVVACLLSFVLSLGLSRTLSRPIQRFAARTLDAARGEARSVDDESTPELAEAARAFNKTLDALSDLRDQLEATERIAARREVARRVAHEVKNPLSPIRTSIETLVKLRRSGSRQFEELFDETAEIVLTEVQRLSRLVTHFSQYASLPSPRLSEISLRQLCASVSQFYAAEAPHLRFESKSSDQESGQVEVVADPEQVRQVVTNLVKNALEATDGVAQPIVILELYPGEDVARIVVRDNGPGVAQPAELFEPYRTTKETGSGLGLPISHRIAIEHGGDLTYGTDSMGGARFELRLPTRGPPRLNRDGDQSAR